MLEPLNVWKNTLKGIALVDTASWVGNFSDWLDSRSTQKLMLMPIIGQVMFRFNKATFQSSLRAFSPTDKQPLSDQRLSNAWATAILSSQMTVMPGSALGAPSPATTWSAVVTIIDPPSVMAAKAVLLGKLGQSKHVDDGMDSGYAEAFRAAFLALTCTVTGTNSLPIPSPLLSPFTPTT